MCSRTSPRTRSPTPTPRSSGARTASSPAYGIAAESLPEDLAIQELLGGLTPEELALVEAAVEVLEVSEGEVVFREGDHADAIYFVLSGLVSVRLPLAETGRDRRLATLGAGVAVGEMAFLDEGARSADVVADRDSKLARLSIGDLHSIGEVAPQRDGDVLGQPGPQPLGTSAPGQRTGADAGALTLSRVSRSARCPWVRRRARRGRRRRAPGRRRPAPPTCTGSAFAAQCVDAHREQEVVAVERARGDLAVDGVVLSVGLDHSHRFRTHRRGRRR